MRDALANALIARPFQAVTTCDKHAAGWFVVLACFTRCPNPAQALCHADRQHQAASLHQVPPRQGYSLFNTLSSRWGRGRWARRSCSSLRLSASTALTSSADLPARSTSRRLGCSCSSTAAVHRSTAVAEPACTHADPLPVLTHACWCLAAGLPGCVCCSPVAAAVWSAVWTSIRQLRLRNSSCGSLRRDRSALPLALTTWAADKCQWLASDRRMHALVSITVNCLC